MMGSAKYHNIPTCDRDHDVEGQVGEERKLEQGLVLRLVSHILTLASYTVFICLFPVTYWICVRRIKDSERIIIFRLGALIGSRGPGRVLVFPWLDRTQTVDVAGTAFSVPPQQLITHDGGIIEIGAEVQYAITDCVALVREVADHQEMIRSLARTVLIRMIIKKNIQQLQKDKNSCQMDVKVEINGQVRKWGLDIRAVILSDVKVLKVPEKEGGIPPLLASLGHSTQTLSPAEFAKFIYSLEEEKESVDVVGAVQAVEQGKLAWSQCLEKVLELEKIDSDNYGTYTITLSDLDLKLFLNISESARSCRATEIDDPSDVSVTLCSSDLAGILKGSLPPLQAYLANRINVTGDVRKLMLLEKLASKRHKPGQTFSI